MLDTDCLLIVVVVEFSASHLSSVKKKMTEKTFFGQERVDEDLILINYYQRLTSQERNP